MKRQMILLITVMLFAASLCACNSERPGDSAARSAGLTASPTEPTAKPTEQTREPGVKMLRDTAPDNGDSHPVPYDIPEIPEGYTLVFRLTREEEQRIYRMTETERERYTTVTEYEYDANGNRIKTIENDGSIKEAFYDERNRLTKEIYHTVAAGSPLECITEYQYDSLGREVVRRETYHENDGSSYESANETVYSEDGSCRELYHTNPDGGRYLTDRYKFDSEGRVICWQQFDSPYGSRQEAEMKYDEHGNLITRIRRLRERSDYPWNEYVERECTYELDRYGVFRCVKEVKRSSYDPERADCSYYLYHFDDNGRVTVIETYGNENYEGVYETLVYGYDDYGNRISEKSLEGDRNGEPWYVRQYEYKPFVIPVELMTDEDKARVGNAGNP